MAHSPRRGRHRRWRRRAQPRTCHSPEHPRADADHKPPDACFNALLLLAVLDIAEGPPRIQEYIERPHPVAYLQAPEGFQCNPDLRVPGRKIATFGVDEEDGPGAGAEVEGQRPPPAALEPGPPQG